jgi:small subunit ribosomal protein S4
MQIGPRYKKARYLGIPVFKKTQTQKFAMRSQRKNTKKSFSRGGKSGYSHQMLEKQKARYSYGISAGQFSNCVRKALQTKGDNSKNLIHILEGRLDNVILRAGFATSRSTARQIVNHGHITVNGKKVNIPSYQVKVGDIISIREGSKKKVLFTKLDEELKNSVSPAWLKVNPETKVITIDGEPTVATSELLFDIQAVLEFFTR